ncbi:MAG: T9SS type A sorting domain-containing protein [Bacteroidota bacterium]
MDQLPAGTYSYTITDAAGCVATGSETVTSKYNSCSGTEVRITIQTDDFPSQNSYQVAEVPIVIFDGVGQFSTVVPPGTLFSQTYCLVDGCYAFGMIDGQANGLCNPTGNVQGYYLIENMATGDTIAFNCDFTNWTREDFCIGGDSLTLVTSSTDVSCFGAADGTATVTATGGDGNYTYNWSNGATVPGITNLAPGTYSVTVTSGSTTETASVTISQPAFLRINNYGVVGVINGNDGIATVNSSVGGVPPYTYTWSNGQTGSQATNLAVGTYTVTVTDATGCTAIQSVTVPFNGASLQLNPSQTMVTCFGDNDGVASVSPVGGVGSYTYSWSTGATTSSISNLSPGNYSVTVSSGTLNNFAFFTIIEPDPLTVTLSGTDNIIGSAVGMAQAAPSGGNGNYNYQWSNGGTNFAITGLTAGTYSVTITDGKGCQTNGSVTINDNFAPITLERDRAIGVGDAWQTISLQNSYQRPVIVATPVIPDNSFDPVVSRIRNVTNTSFELRIQRPGGTTNDSYSVEYLVVEEGVYDATTYGVNIEAVRTTSSKTAAKGRWGNSYREGRTYQQAYQNPVVLGQVMSSNDSDWSVFWASRTNSRAGEPTSTNLACGKQVSEDIDRTRTNETIGYIVIEAGQGTINGLDYEAGLGADIVRGQNNSQVGYLYNTPSLTLVGGVLSTAGLDGGDGGWPVFKADPIGSGGFRLAFEEDQIGDSERSHTTEPVAYLVFGFNNSNSSPTPAAESNPSVVAAAPVSAPVSTAHDLLLFPNPAREQLQIRWVATANTEVQLRIMDLSGRSLLQRSLFSDPNGQLTAQLNLNNWRPGVYLLQVKSGQTQRTERLIIQ